MHTDFFVHAKCTIFRLKRGVRFFFNVCSRFYKIYVFPKSIYWYEAPKTRLSIYFDIYQLVRGTLKKIKMYIETVIEPKYGAFY